MRKEGGKLFLFVNDMIGKFQENQLKNQLSLDNNLARCRNKKSIAFPCTSELQTIRKGNIIFYEVAREKKPK